jgi:methyl-accepting chemotaxis protein
MKSKETGQGDNTEGAMEQLSQKDRRPGLGRKMALYLLLMVTVYFSVTVYLVFDLGNREFHQEIEQSVSQNPGGQSNPGILPPLRRFQLKMAILLILTDVGTTAGAYFLFHKNIVKPLKVMEKTIARMNEGHLEESMPTNSNDEIGRIGEMVNGMASNFQEVLLFTNAISRGTKDLLATLNTDIANAVCPEAKERADEGIQELFCQIGELDEVVHSFSFFQVKIENGRILDDSPCHNEGRRDVSEL